MKKVLSLITIVAIILCTCTSVYAAGYSFDLQYEGTIIKNIEKNANVLLIGDAGSAFATVQIKVDITGPATPEILATDSTGVVYNIAQIGYWGPPSGFPVQGDFVNTTPIKATFPEEGTYTIKLSLIDLANANTVITTRTFSIEVFEDAPAVDDIITDNQIAVDNTVEELPKTGISVLDYILYIGILTIVLTISVLYIKRKKLDA